MIRAVRTFNEAQRPLDTVSRQRRASSPSGAGSCSTRRDLRPERNLPTAFVARDGSVPALVAGVRRIAVVTPNPVDVTLVVARELGLDEVYAIGGAQAVAALAYGTDSIAPVDRIVGPGNAYVTAAKPRLEPVGSIPAEPERGDRDCRRDRGCRRVCRDLLAQAEHRPTARRFS
jgi:histidinol dehydrogenase